MSQSLLVRTFVVLHTFPTLPFPHRLLLDAAGAGGRRSGQLRVLLELPPTVRGGARRGIVLALDEGMRDEPSPATCGVGARVVLRGDRWTVTGRTRHTDCESLHLTGCGRVNGGVERTFLLPCDRARAIGGRRRLMIVPTGAWLERVRRELIATTPAGSVAAAGPAGIAVLPHQLVAPLAMLWGGHLRILLADAVGLGKTIQAGLVLAQLAWRDPSTRAIVIAPAALREQWRDELKVRFALDATIADTSWLIERGRVLPSHVNPWSLPGVYVASLDLVKRPEVLRSLEHVLWDLTVVDEAHQATPGTARLTAVDAIARRARRVLLLTATPPFGDAGHLRALESIGQWGEHDDLLTLRRTRERAGAASGRKSILLAVRLSSAERRMQRLLGAYAAEVWTSTADDRHRARRLTATLLKKRALSSAHSLAASVRRRLQLLEDLTSASVEQLWLPWGDEDPLPDDPSESILATRGLADPRREHALLEQIVRAADLAAAQESKVRLLARFVRRAREPLLIFTEYRDTLSYLAAVLVRHRPLQLHGGMSLAERQAVVREFERSGDLLLATDAAAEGLNLHHRCRTVVHFEVPWTPARLEQRTGRVDRLGQHRRVHEVLLVANHSSEQLVLAPLVRRIRASTSHDRTRWQALDESAVAATILGGTPLGAQTSGPRDDPAPPDLEAAASAEASRLLRWRRLAHHVSSSTDVPSRVAVSRAASGSDPAHVLVRVSYETPDARILAGELVLLAVTVAWRTSPAAWSSLRRAARELTTVHAETIAARVREHLAVPGMRIEDALRTSVSVAQREAHIVTAHAAAARALVQAGLFDGRAVAEAAARTRAAAALAEESGARASHAAASTVETRIEVVAIHFGPIGHR